MYYYKNRTQKWKKNLKMNYSDTSNISNSTIKYLIDKFEKASSVHDALSKGRKSGDTEEAKWNHTADQSYAYHLQPSFSITGTGFTYSNLLRYLGSSTETVAFQVYEILKIDHQFLQFFWLGSKI